MVSLVTKLAGMTWKHARRVVIIILGFSVLLIGVAMMALPGPAIIVIPAGLAILATEFVWAARLLKHLKQRAKQLTQAVMGKRETQTIDPEASQNSPPSAAGPMPTSTHAGRTDEVRDARSKDRAPTLHETPSD